MKNFFKKIQQTLADAALYEMGVEDNRRLQAVHKPFRQSIEESLIEIAYAEAAEYDEIHRAIRREHATEDERIHPDDCQTGDNDICFAH